MGTGVTIFPPSACQAFSNLRTLDLYEIPLAEECFGYLSKAPSLHTLKVCVRDFQMKITAGSTHHDVFCSLQYLHVTLDSFKTASNLFQYYSLSTNCRGIKIFSDTLPSYHDFNQLVNTICSKQPLISLTEVTLSQSWEVPDESPKCILEPCDLEPLFKLVNLEKLHIIDIISFQKIDNTLVWEIANAWPRLITLQLDCDHPRDQAHSSVTVEGLCALTSCAQLKTLSIALDPSVPDVNSLDGQRKFPCTSPLVDLWVGFSPIVDPPAIASFLSAIFPNLKKIHAGKEDEERETEQVRLWRQVQGLHSHFMVVRRQERLWSVENGGAHI